MGDSREIEICRSLRPGAPYVECDCYVHDFVAELLDIDSVRVNGYKSTKSRGFTVTDAEGRPITDPRERQAAIESVLGESLDHLDQTSKQIKLIDDRLFRLKQQTTEQIGETVEVYEFGKAEPVGVVYSLPPTRIDGGEFSVEGGVGEATKLVYKRNGRTVARRMPSSENLNEVVEDMVREMNLGDTIDTIAEAMYPLQNEWK